jgi:hypothetical protein
MSGQWVYRVTVPDEKSDAFISALVDIDLIGYENLRVLSDPDGEGEEDA